MKVTGDPLRPVRVAVAVWVPALDPRVRVALDTPLASVWLEAGAIDPPPLPTAQFTVTPATGLPA